MPGEQPYLAQFKQWDDDELRIACEHVAQLEHHPGFEALTRVLDEVHGNAMDRLLSSHAGAEGRIMDQAEYARLVGFLSGLRQPMAAVKAFALAESKRRKRNTPEGDTP